MNRTHPPRPAAWLLRGLLLLALVGLVYLGWRAAATALYARAALADLDRVQAIAADPELSRLPAVEADLAALETHLIGTRRAGAPFLALAPRLGWLPRYGGDVTAAPLLLDMAVEVAGAGRTALAALMPLAALTAEGGGLALLPQLADGLAAAAPQLAVAREGLARANALAATIPPVSIDRLAGPLALLDRWLPLAVDGLELAEIATALLAAEGERTYLVLAQNSDELRATGGFISAIGVIRFADGALTEMSFADSYAADNFGVPQLTPPAPLFEQMGLQLWLVRDSNWSPDFPQAAEVARAMYAQNQGVWADGVVALDLEAVRLLVDALGPLQVAGADEPVTGANALTWMKRAWQAPGSGEGTVAEVATSDWWLNRKNFMSDLAAALLARVAVGGDLNVTALARAGLTMLDQRHLQIFVDDPPAAALLARHGWDGALAAPAGSDFLAVIDSNVGFNKANALVQPALAYTVTPAADGWVATLTLTYTHRGAPGAEETCDRTPRYGDSYDALAQRCYWDYLRVYVPRGATLLAAEGLKTTLSEAGEGATTVFAGDFVVRPGAQHTVTLRYRLPPEVGTAPYRLRVRKQAGAVDSPLTIDAAGCRVETTLAADYTFTCGVSH